MFLFTTPQASYTKAPQGQPVLEAIRQGAAKTGVSFDYLVKTAQRESGPNINPQAQSASSTAGGPFGFINATWLSLIKAQGSEVGLSDYANAISLKKDGTADVADPSTKQAILDLKQSPEISSVMAGVLTRNNQSQLQAGLGRTPTAGELYMAHFLGANGAKDLISLAQTQPSRQVAADFPSAAAANRSIFYNREGRARSAFDVYKILTADHHTIKEPVLNESALAVSQERPASFAAQDGPAFHGLFQTNTRSNPVSDSVAKLWQHRTAEHSKSPSLYAFYPRSDQKEHIQQSTPENSAQVKDDTEYVQWPQPPRRPDNVSISVLPVKSTVQPLDMSRFMSTSVQKAL